LSIDIFKLPNNDFLVYLSSPSAQNLFNSNCNSGIATSGDLHIESSTLTSEYKYSIYSLEKNVLIDNLDIDTSSSPAFKARFAVGENLKQTQAFILSIYKGAQKFTDSFKLNVGSTGLLFSSNDFFVIPTDKFYTFEATAPVSQQSKTYEIMFYILLALVLFVVIFNQVFTYKNK